MARVIITFKVMPESLDVNLEDIKTILTREIEAFDGVLNGEMTEEPVAFGLKYVKVSFSYDEAKGTTDDLEDKLTSEELIQSVDVLAVGRAMG
ncbi:elongation factor 1-beta [Candidatus Woesearchaeota archaeon]|jgi:elongation factor 1-beta|nr:elongation factor 1-beta [Candidatus Woesearchaeota archaeon]